MRHANIAVLMCGLDMGGGGGGVNVDALVFAGSLHGHGRNVHAESLDPHKYTSGCYLGLA